MSDEELILKGLLFFVVVSSGCIDAEASLKMNSVGGTELGEKASVDVVDLHPDFEEVIKQGSFVTPENVGAEVLKHDFPVLYNESLYNVERSEAGTQDRIRIEYRADKGQNSEPDEINLTRGEKVIVDAALDHASVSPNASMIVYAETYTETELNKSELANRNQTVFLDEETAISISKQAEENTTVQLYNYSSQKIAENLSQYSESIRENYRFKLNASNLSERLLDKATKESYYGDETAELKKIFEALKQGKPIKSSSYGATWVVDYNGDIFWTEASGPSLENEFNK